jgi:hypothetical protein
MYQSNQTDISSVNSVFFLLQKLFKLPIFEKFEFSS